MTKIEIINETVQFYESDPSRRAVQDETCKYLVDNGNKCALGRCFAEDAIEKYGHYQGSVNMLIADNNLLDDGFQLLLKPEYRGHSINFWQAIQHYHDRFYFWQDKEIATNNRKQFVEGMLKQYAENEG